MNKVCFGGKSQTKPIKKHLKIITVNKNEDKISQQKIELSECCSRSKLKRQI